MTARSRKRVFIVKPSGNEDWKVCLHDGRTSITECYEHDLYKEVGSVPQKNQALLIARKYGAKRPRVI